MLKPDEPMNTPTGDDDEFGDGGAPPISTDNFEPIPDMPHVAALHWCIHCGLQFVESVICPRCGQGMTRLAA
jgi:hypothetical protein